jgi:phosphoglycolate phosphatase
VGDANSDLRMARAAGVPVVLGYRAGWRRPVSLDSSFPQLDHWQELALVGPSGLPLDAASIPGGNGEPVGISSPID